MTGFVSLSFLSDGKEKLPDKKTADICEQKSDSDCRSLWSKYFFVMQKPNKIFLYCNSVAFSSILGDVDDVNLICTTNYQSSNPYKEEQLILAEFLNKLGF